MAGKKSALMEEKIIQATLNVIEEKTISETRMRLIAEKAQVYPSNLHYYYKSKKDLMMAVQKRVADRCLELRQAALLEAGNDLESQLDVFLKQKLSFIREEPKYDYAEIDFWIQSRFDDEFREEFKRSFGGWRGELQQLIKTYAPHMDARKQVLLPTMIISLLEGATIQYLVDEKAFSVEEYFDYCKELIMKELVDR